MVTPFDEQGAMDLDAARDLARWLVDNGNDGLVVAGTTGEAPTLSDEEKLSLWAAVCQAVTVPVIAGAGTNDTAHSVRLVREASKTGLAGILAVTPYYSRPSQDGIFEHFRAVSAATDLPVMVYDIPIRTGRKIVHENLLRMAREIPNVVAVKDASGDPSGSARLLAEAPGDFELYSGDDGLTLPLMAIGAVGTVGVATHWSGRQHQEMLAAFAKGDIDLAREINASLIPSFAFETGDAAPNPIPAKAMMRTLGHSVGQCRLPLGSAPAGLEEKARAVYAALNG